MLVLSKNAPASGEAMTNAVTSSVREIPCARSRAWALARML
jgi:hypothetical protein